VSVSDAFDLAAFRARGFATIAGAVDGDVVAEMRARLWAALGGQGIDEHDATTWPSGSVEGLRAIRRDDRRPADTPAVRAVVEDLFGAVPWKPPTSWGQALAAFPEPGPWSVPRTGWHCDSPFWFAPDKIWGVVVFLFLDDVESHGGATVALDGSPELVRHHLAGRDDLGTAKPTDVLEELWAQHDVFATHDVVELTGRAGDAVVSHPWLLHRASANTSSRPRLQRAARFQRRFGPGR
jgi:hypothetical protein